jgi:hypothetical protein
MIQRRQYKAFGCNFSGDQWKDEEIDYFDRLVYTYDAKDVKILSAKVNGFVRNRHQVHIPSVILKDTVESEVILCFIILNLLHVSYFQGNYHC